MPIAPLKSNQINPNTDMKDKINEIIEVLNTLDPTATAAAITALEDWRATGVATDSFDAAGSEVATITDGLVTAIA